MGCVTRPIPTVADVSQSLLEVSDLHVQFPLDQGTVRAVDGLSYSIARGRTLGVVGESGCGKTVTAHSILRILPRPGEIVSGEIVFDGRDLLKLKEDDMRKVRGNEIALVFQEPMASLSPVHTIGHQMTERVRLHSRVDAATARTQVLD